MKILLTFFMLLTSLFSMTEVNIVLPKSNIDTRESYYVELLQLALDKTKSKFGDYKLTIKKEDISRQRLATFLAEGSSFVDVIWTGTNIEREKAMLPIRIPLLKGLKGMRLLIINKHNQSLFSNINNVDELKKLVAVQGVDWPDTAILKSNGFKIETSPNYEGMFMQIDSSRADYFPRAINEAYVEVNLHKNLNLMVESKIVLYYFLPNFFFVNVKKSNLRDRIEEGLKIAINDGSFDKLFYNHPSNVALKTINFSKMKIFKLDNPFLSEETKKLMYRKDLIIPIIKK